MSLGRLENPLAKGMIRGQEIVPLLSGISVGLTVDSGNVLQVF